MPSRPSRCVLQRVGVPPGPRHPGTYVVALLLHTSSPYAAGTSQLGSTTIGIQTKEGVVLGVEKRVQSPLLESSSIEKIMEIDSHVGCAMSGLTADARTMVDHARVTAQVSGHT